MHAFTKRILLHISIVILVFLAFNFLAAVIVQAIEDLNYTDSFYLTMSASTLSGYGNVAPETDGGKWFISFFQLFGFGIFFYLLTLIIITDREMYYLSGKDEVFAVRDERRRSTRRRK